MALSPFSLRFSQLTLAASIATLLSGCWEGTTKGVQATVLAVNGTVTISGNARRQSVPLTPGVNPGKGDILEINGSSRAALSLLPNLLVQLAGDSRLEILRLAITKDGNDTGGPMRARYADVRLQAGRMIASQVWGEATAIFNVFTPQGQLVTTSNTLFSIECDGQKTRIVCVSGSVGFRTNESKEVTQIPPGFVGEWLGSDARLIAAETDARAQDDLQTGLEVEEILRGLSDQRRLVLPR